MENEVETDGIDRDSRNLIEVTILGKPYQVHYLYIYIYTPIIVT